MGGKNAGELMTPCAAKALKMNSAICAEIKMARPNTARRAWGNPLERAWKKAD